MTTGLMFSRIATRHGYNIFDYVEYPSLIKGGHNVYEVRVSSAKVYSQEYGVDFLMALNRDTIDRHKDKVRSRGIVVYDGDNIEVKKEEFSQGVVLYSLPLTRLTKEAGAVKVMENNVALGASMAILSMDLKVLFSVIESIFARKGEEIIDQNKQAAKVGYEYVSKNPPKEFKHKLLKREEKSQMVVSGNEAVGLGAIVAGCKFYVAYPMTPSSSILHFMAAHGEKYGVMVKHAEDEISVVNMAIGASYCGVRSMLATAGGGFSLMVEGLGLAAVTETPLVFMIGQRPGPATGMPTWTSQGDLHFVINASQDEFPRIVLAPGDMKEAFYLTVEAFNLAEMYQMPVFILSDKYLAESHSTCDKYDLSEIKINRGKLLSWEEGDKVENYLRYHAAEDGISKRALPGMKKALFAANSYEHNEYGWSTEDAEERVKQVDKRIRKITTYKADIPPQKIYGDKNADLTLIGWGSTKLPALQALQDLKEEDEDVKINYLHINHVWPFKSDQIKSVLTKAKKTMLLEGNSQGQLGGIIRQETGMEIENKYLKYDGRPFYPEDIKKKVKEAIEK